MSSVRGSYLPSGHQPSAWIVTRKSSEKPIESSKCQRYRLNRRGPCGSSTHAMGRSQYGVLNTCSGPDLPSLKKHQAPPKLSLIHISEPTRLGMISYAVFC